MCLGLTPLCSWYVCRFNLLNNWERFEEPMTLWVARFSKEAKFRYWGGFSHRSCLTRERDASD